MKKEGIIVNDRRNIHIINGIYILSVHICLDNNIYEIAILFGNGLYVYSKELTIKELLEEIKEFLDNPSKLAIKIINSDKE